MNGFFNVLKPSGITSSDAVIKIRNIITKAQNAKIKTGHLGTLDPQAAGVLPVAVGSATKLFDYLLSKKKLYRATFVFGVTTDTLDSEGIVTDKQPISISKSDILQTILDFLGEIAQLPPSYSAKSVKGVRAYKLARQGIEVNLSPKNITIYDITLVEGKDNIYTFDISCSGGTYIRSLCRDMAAALNTVGYMSSLIRLANGTFWIEDAKTIEEISDNLQQNFLTIQEFGKNLQKYCINCNIKSIDNGVVMQYDDLPDSIFELYVNETPYGIAVKNKEKLKVILRYVS